ncbi:MULTISPECIES: sulfurtransferase TusA [Marinomonas]|uniref:Sulfurtransferase TusA n=1 Tax=Marinomonas arctica TaxID=383750 RepID=A0A7H1JBK8_9GAMM|nr:MULTISPECIES: sulfurtransferase TusA [Marinomonas]MCS7485574.1 sulfurtransferase [Marinomonas sp. BSi20414]QNT07874.1 sulfurtransferase TusA [Marinomonas arctica]GGN26027.1 sulfurtransferase TusD [Marinomonas arctica]
MEHQALLDATGLLCPEPVMLLHVEMRKLTAKQVLKVIATDSSTTRDIPKFCQFLGHKLIEQNQQGDIYTYWIEKKEK